MTELDRNSVESWEATYRRGQAASFWTEDPVPYVTRLTERFPGDAHPLVLDIPCGDGRNLVPWAIERSSVIGVDSSPTAIQNASRMLGNSRQRNVLLLTGDVFALPFYDSQFDIVFCWDLLGHLQDAAGAIRELTRICKPTGRILGSVFAADDSVRQMDMEQLSEKESLYKGQFFFRFYEETDVVSLLREADVNNERVELAVWDEGPHPGYREYPHEHRSWCFEASKRVG